MSLCPQAMLLLVPGFLLIGWGRSLPALGLGLLLYAFGECVAGGSQWTGVDTCPGLTALLAPAAAAVVVPCLSSAVAGYGEPFPHPCTGAPPPGRVGLAPDRVSPQAHPHRRAR